MRDRKPVSRGAASQRALLSATVVVSAAAIAFLALRSSPYISEVPWIPHPVSRWADHNGVARNAVAFFAFGLLWFTGLGRNTGHVATITIFSVGIEVAQLWIPHRFFDWRDIGATLLGLTAAWIVVTSATLLRRRPAEPC